MGPVIQILRKGGGGGGVGGLPKKCFSALRASVWSKNRGRGRTPPGPSPESATVMYIECLSFMEMPDTQITFYHRERIPRLRAKNKFFSRIFCDGNRSVPVALQCRPSLPNVCNLCTILQPGHLRVLLPSNFSSIRLQLETF